MKMQDSLLLEAAFSELLPVERDLRDDHAPVDNVYAQDGGSSGVGHERSCPSANEVDAGGHCVTSHRDCRLFVDHF